MMGLGVGIVAGAALIARGMANSARLVLRDELVPIPGLPPAFEGFRVLHLTDLHLRQGSSRIEQVLDIVEETDPDLVCLTGDYAFTALSAPDVERLLRGLALRPGVAAVFGNADYRPGITARVRARWERIVPFLTNRAMSLTRDGQTLWLVGVDDPHQDLDDLDAAMADVPDDAVALLLAHSPDIARRAIPPQIRLVLAGHTHGGQICLPGGRALFTNMRLPNACASGFTQLPHALMYVSPGIGSTRVPLRYGCLPEVTVFTLARQV